MEHQELHWPLAVLTRAIRYKNLSGAAIQIGISQPQLSRIIKKIEQTLQINLLDRRTKRSSQWTKEARKLAQIYLESEDVLSRKLSHLQNSQKLRQIRIVTLEGLLSIACKVSLFLEKDLGVQNIFIDVLDLNEVSERIVSGQTDLALTSISPTRGKLQRRKIIGYQDLVRQSSNTNQYQILSQFEYLGLSKNQKKNLESQKTLVSNSLTLRKYWHETFGSQSIQLPSELKLKNSKGRQEVLLLGAEFLPESIWRRVETFQLLTSCSN